jgi:hypothetical protein
VRVEVEAALTRNIRVIPVLVDGAQMPRAADLPTSLAKLVRRQALELSPSRFGSDTGRLISVLDSGLAEAQARPAATEPRLPVPPSPASHDMDTHRTSESAQEHGPTAAALDGRLLLAGSLAVLGAVLTIAALFPTFIDQFRQISSPANTSQVIIRAAVALGAGVCMFVPRTRRLIGPGLLLGCVATAPTWAAYDFIVMDAYPPAGAGLWLHLIGMAVWLLACGLVLISLAQARDVHLALWLPEGAIAWLVAGVGVVGAVALFLQVQGAPTIPGRDGQFVASVDLPPLILAAAITLVVPAAAALALPRQFGVALLAGWIGGGASVAAFYTGLPGGVFGTTILAFVVLIIPFARAAQPSGVERTVPE